MPDTFEAVFILTLLLPGCLGYFVFTMIYNGKIEDNVSKIVYIGIFNLVPLLIYGGLSRSDVWSMARGEGTLDVANIEAFVHTWLIQLSLISVAIGIVASAAANYSPLHSLLIRGKVTRRTPDASVLASLIARQPRSYFKFRFKSGGYVIGHPKLYSLSGSESVIFLDDAARRPPRPAAGQSQPSEYDVAGPGILLLNFDDVLCVEILSGDQNG